MMFDSFVQVFFFSFFLVCICVGCYVVFSKAQNRGQSIGGALSGSSENQNFETLLELCSHWIIAGSGEMEENKCSYLKKPWGNHLK